MSRPRYLHVPRAFYYNEDSAEYSESEVETWVGNHPDCQHISSGWTHQQPVTREQTLPVHEHMVAGSPDITELYRRKPDERYVLQPEVMLPEDTSRFYYRSGHSAMSRLPPQQHRLTSGSHIVQQSPQQIVTSTMTSPQMQPRHFYGPDEGGGPPQIYEPYMYHGTIPNSMSPGRRGTQVLQESTAPVGKVLRAVRHSKPVVSVRTPRYYHRTPGSIYKRPSTLCLPVTCQPDPGLYHNRHTLARSRFSAVQNVTEDSTPRKPVYGLFNKPYISPQNIEVQDNVPNSTRSAPPTVDLETKLGILNPNDLEYLKQFLLEKRDAGYGYKGSGDHKRRVCDDESEVEDDEQRKQQFNMMMDQFHDLFPESRSYGKPKNLSRSNLRVKNRSKRNSSLRISSQTHLLQPRLPPCLKGKKKRSSSKGSLKSEASNTRHDKLEIEQITTDALDSLLIDLQKNGLTNSDQQLIDSTNSSRINTARSNSSISRINDVVKKLSQSDCMIQNEKLDQNSNFEEFGPFQGSSDNEAKEQLFKPERKGKKSRGHSGRRTSKKHSLSSSNSEPKNQKIPSSDSLSELHRSKSYIVNLIDRALSRELGTIPEERPSKQISSHHSSQDTKVAFNSLSTSTESKQQLDNEFCTNLTNALAHSIANTPKSSSKPSTEAFNQPSSSGANVTAEASKNTTIPKEEELLFGISKDEPQYIKQLKKIRWGHLRHIQREFKRLEDLERLLDSCSNDEQD